MSDSPFTDLLAKLEAAFVGRRELNVALFAIAHGYDFSFRPGGNVKCGLRAAAAQNHANASLTDQARGEQ